MKPLSFHFPLYYSVFNWLAGIVACGSKRKEEEEEKKGPVAMATENISFSQSVCM